MCEHTCFEVQGADGERLVLFARGSCECCRRPGAWRGAATFVADGSQGLVAVGPGEYADVDSGKRFYSR